MTLRVSGGVAVNSGGGSVHVPAGVPSFSRLKGAEALPCEDVQFLQSIADSKGIIRKRKAPVPDVRDEPSSDEDGENCEMPCEELDALGLGFSNLDIASHGPRAAGKLLLKALDEGVDRWCHVGAVCSLLCRSANVCA